MRGRARGDVGQQLQVGTAQRAVLGDVGDHVPDAARLVEAPEDLPEVPALLGPAACGERGAAHVEADGDAVAVLADDLGRPGRVLEGGGAQVDAPRAGREGALQRLVVADAARQLDLDVQLADHAREQLGVRTAPEGGVQVHEVDPLGAAGLPVQGGRERVAVRGLRAGLALDEADGLAVGDVDGGQEHKSLGHLSPKSVSESD